MMNIESIDPIASQRDHMKELVIAWANINSHTNNYVGLNLFKHKLLDAFQPLDCAAEEIACPPRQVVGTDGLLQELPTGSLLRFVKHPHAPLKVLFVGHMDTVYPVDSSFQHVESLDDNVLRGPGVADMKGGIVVLYKALQWLEQSSLKGLLGWEVLLNSDEEVGSISSSSFIEASARNHQIGLVFEPALPDGAMVSERKGSANFTIVARGISAHAGRDFERGRNAIVVLARCLTALQNLNNHYIGTTVNIGSIQGGKGWNIVPDLAICHINIRAKTSKELALTKAAIREIVNGAVPNDGTSLELIEISSRSPKICNENQKHLMAAIEYCANQLNMPCTWKKSGGVCDGNILSHAGLPNIDTLGPIGGHLHTHQEYVLIDSLVKKTQLTALFLEHLIKDKTFRENLYE